MYDEYGEFRGRVLINQHEWQVHYFNALDTKMGPDNNDEFHDALEQFVDDPDSVIDLVVYCANGACYVCNHETVEAAFKFVMIWNLTTDSFALILVGCLLTPSRRRSSVLLNLHACP
jgi:hypothetical protein